MNIHHGGMVTMERAHTHTHTHTNTHADDGHIWLAGGDSSDDRASCPH